MHISKTNTIAGTTPIVSTGASATDLPSNITSYDHSLNYTASTSRLAMQWGSIGQCNYVGISAGNLAGSTVTIRNENQVLTTITPERDNVLMYVFNQISVSNLIVIIETASNVRVTVNCIAAGLAFEVPNLGEQAGYSRAWLDRPWEARSVTNGQGAPINNMIRRTALRANLRLPNMLVSFSRGEWQDFVDFMEFNAFFVNEVQSLPQSSYMGFNGKSTVTANNSTRALDDISLRFDLHNGL